MNENASEPRQVTLQTLPDLVGTTFGPSAPIVINQQRIDSFASVTGDTQWLHVDRERAKTGPFGTTVAHGYLTLSIGPTLLQTLFEVTDASHVINCRVINARFMAPVRVDSLVRLTAHVSAIDKLRNGYSVKLEATFSVDGLPSPVCRAEFVLRYDGKVPS